MTTSLKHTLNPGFALLFAVGVERLYKVLDPVVLDEGHAESILIPDFYMPLTMVLLTLVFGSLSAIANDRFLDARPHASATSWSALLSYCSVFFALWMFYFSVDLAFVGRWWFGYAALCAVNGLWNWAVIKPPYQKPHVAANFSIAVVIGISLTFWPSLLSAPLWFYVLLCVIALAKYWQRGRERFGQLKP